jgi:hypothetical protein
MKKLPYNSSLKKLTVKLFFTMALLTTVFANAQEDVANDITTSMDFDTDLEAPMLEADYLSFPIDFGNNMDISSSFGGDITATTPFPDDVTDVVPGAPVDDWALPFALLSLISGYFYFRKRTTIFNS